MISAGNSGNALNTIGDPSVATDVVSVGASISKATWKANYGSDVAFDKNMLTFSSGGPREDGGFKPNITAPGSAISTTPTWQPGGPVAEAGYSLPPGYSHFNGTSMASPQAAGAMALLISAGKARGVSTTPAQLRQAVYSTAGYNSTVPAFLQGHGEIDVPAAWTLLAQTLRPDTFTVAAPVCTEIWKILGETPGHRDLQPVRRRSGWPRGRREAQLHRHGDPHVRRQEERDATRSPCAGTTAPTRCRRRRSPCR